MGLDMYLSRQVRAEAAYWRKANQIHNWFVKNCGDGVEDSNLVVTKDKLRELLAVCYEVVAASKLVKGKVKNGETLVGNAWTPVIEDGRVIKDPSAAKALLPTTSGFFFGSTDYDEWYLSDVKLTIEQIEKILSDDDGEDMEYVYDSSY